MKFEWNEEKNRQNINKHGVSFEQATRIFDGFTIDRIDDRFLYDEVREFSLGIANHVLILAVVHTDRHGVCRINSAWPAINWERRHYESEVQKTFKL